MMLRPLSVDEIWKGVTKSATGVSPAISRSREGIGWVTARLDAWCAEGKDVANERTTDARPQAATRSDALIATPTSPRFIDRAKDSPVPLFRFVRQAIPPWLTNSLPSGETEAARGDQSHWQEGARSGHRLPASLFGLARQRGSAPLSAEHRATRRSRQSAPGWRLPRRGLPGARPAGCGPATADRRRRGAEEA